MTRVGASAAVVVFLLVPAVIVAQSPEMPELTDTQLHARAAMNAMALTAAGIADAKARGVSPRDWGLAVGERFSSSWGSEQTPQSIIRGMWANVLSLTPGVALELGDYSDATASIRLPADWPAQMDRPERWYGVNRDDYRAALAGMLDGIARSFGLRGDVEAAPDAVLMVVRR